MTKDSPTSAEQQIREAIAALRADDVSVQNRALEQLLQLGEAVVPALIQEYQTPGANQRQVMFLLSRLGDDRAVETFMEELAHDDEQVRAYAAQGLVHLNHPSALEACLQTINDGADELHLDITPAVTALADMGLQAVPALLELMMSDDEATRLHAQRALELFIDKRHGFMASRGFPSPQHEQAARNEWKANGDYDYLSDETTRTAAVGKWKEWFTRQEKS